MNRIDIPLIAEIEFSIKQVSHEFKKILKELYEIKIKAMGFIGDNSSLINKEKFFFILDYCNENDIYPVITINKSGMARLTKNDLNRIINYKFVTIRLEFVNNIINKILSSRFKIFFSNFVLNFIFQCNWNHLFYKF